MANNKIRVAIIQGDTEEAGYESLLNTFAEPEILELCTPVIYCSEKTAGYLKKNLQIRCQLTVIDNDNELLNRALADSDKGVFDVLVCTPTIKGALKVSQPIYVNDSMRLVFANNGNVKDAANSISTECIVEKVTALCNSLKRDFRVQNPRIALLALNKEEGTEEKDIIVPAITELTSKGIQAFGPYTADTFIEEWHYDVFDGVMAMYVGQASLPETDSIIVADNMPVVCTALGNGADTDAMRKAIYMAIDIFRYQKEYDAPMSNPLPKLYRERPDNGEKLRFSIPKKKEE